jgi:hypothetical protein
MDYHIEVRNSKGKWERVASFQNGIDRDDCMSFLQGRYVDCKFRMVNDE